MDPIALPKPGISTDTAKLLEKAAELTEALNSQIRANPWARSWKVPVEGGPGLYSLEHRAALQVAAAFDRKEDYGAAVIAGRISQVVVVRKGNNPYREV